MNDTIINVAPVVKPIVPRPQNLSHADSAFMGYYHTNENHLFQLDSNRVYSDLHRTRYQKMDADTTNFFVEEIESEREDVILTVSQRGETVLQAQSGWIMSVIMLSVLLYAFIRVRSMAYFNGLFSMLASSIDYRQTTQYIERQGRWENRVVLFVSFFILPLIAYQMLAIRINEVLDVTGFRCFLMIMAIESIYFLYKVIAYGLISFAFDSSKIINQVHQLRTLTINLFGVLIFPLTVIFLFTAEKYYNVLIIITLAMFVVLTVWQLLKSFKIFSLNIVTLFYFILYLCSVEILPVVCLLKIYYMVGF